MLAPPAAAPDWNRLYETAAAQAGHFTTKQAAEAGYSPQLLVHYLNIDKAIRVRRGIYRLVHFPADEHEDLVTAWLWSELTGVVSHASALALHGLSDALPAHIHLTLPEAWRRRRFRVPRELILHHADIPADDRSWFGAVPTTNARRTLNDCAQSSLTPDLLQQAAQQALQRGLVTRAELGPVESALASFGGLAT